MAGVILTGHGGPEKLEYKTDLPVPNVNANEVLIKVTAAGINNVDIKHELGGTAKGSKPRLPQNHRMRVAAAQTTTHPGPALH
jgi:NADPH:quinone reductase-like Zn-dependent oxidoreductase